MDAFDRERYASIYNTLAEILERDRPSDPEEHQISYVLGNLARRIFVNSGYLPPDELLEETARMLRSGNHGHLQTMAKRLREHAQHLAELDE